MNAFSLAGGALIGAGISAILGFGNGPSLIFAGLILGLGGLAEVHRNRRP